MIASSEAPIRASASADAETLGTLAASDIFDVLEVAVRHCWGQRRLDRIVGYVETSRLRIAPNAGVSVA